MAYSQRLAHIRNFSITGLVGMVLTFCFDALAVAVDPVIAAAGAVVTAIILDSKAEIHGWVQKLQSHELDAALKLLLISVVMLPLLPNAPMGPGGVLNPREIWWMVVMIASISFIGYFAIRVAGPRKGILFTSLFAGLSSSTALTLHFARLSGPALYLWRVHSRQFQVTQPNLSQNPLDLSSALSFGALLTLILLLGQFLEDGFGSAGVYALAAASGVADVDAITLSLARLSNDGLAADTAVLAIVLAATVNNLAKTGIAWTLGNRQTGLLVAGPMVLSLSAGLLIAWLQ